MNWGSTARDAAPPTDKGRQLVIEWLSQKWTDPSSHSFWPVEQTSARKRSNAVSQRHGVIHIDHRDGNIRGCCPCHQRHHHGHYSCAHRHGGGGVSQAAGVEKDRVTHTIESAFFGLPSRDVPLIDLRRKPRRDQRAGRNHYTVS
jgi:hypothetical protein